MTWIAHLVCSTLDPHKSHHVPTPWRKNISGVGGVKEIDYLNLSVAISFHFERRHSGQERPANFNLLAHSSSGQPTKGSGIKEKGGTVDVRGEVWRKRRSRQQKKQACFTSELSRYRTSISDSALEFTSRHRQHRQHHPSRPVCLPQFRQYVTLPCMVTGTTNLSPAYLTSKA